MDYKEYRRGYRTGILDVAELIEYVIEESEDVHNEQYTADYWTIQGFKRAHKYIMEFIADYDEYIRMCESEVEFNEVNEVSKNRQQKC